MAPVLPVRVIAVIEPVRLTFGLMGLLGDDLAEDAALSGKSDMLDLLVTENCSTATMNNNEVLLLIVVQKSAFCDENRAKPREDNLLLCYFSSHTIIIADTSNYLFIS
jgi:hypothetical protein